MVWATRVTKCDTKPCEIVVITTDIHKVSNNITRQKNNRNAEAKLSALMR